MVLSSLSYMLRQAKSPGAEVRPLGHIWHLHLGFCCLEQLTGAVGWHPDGLTHPTQTVTIRIYSSDLAQTKGVIDTT